MNIHVNTGIRYAHMRPDLHACSFLTCQEEIQKIIKHIKLWLGDIKKVVAASVAGASEKFLTACASLTPRGPEVFRRLSASSDKSPRHPALRYIRGLLSRFLPGCGRYSSSPRVPFEPLFGLEVQATTLIRAVDREMAQAKEPCHEYN